MIFRRYRILIVIAFLGIFTSKVFIAVAPVFINYLDQKTVNSVILQLEQEHDSEGDAKTLLKFTAYKPADLYFIFSYPPSPDRAGLKNSFIEHFKRYVNPYHPTVPTPPPDCA